MCLLKTVSNLSTLHVRHSLRIRLCSTYLLFHRNNCCTSIACLVLYCFYSAILLLLFLFTVFCVCSCSPSFYFCLELAL